MKNINEGKHSQPRSPLGLESDAAPRYLKHEHVTDFNGRDRLLNS